MEESVFFQKAVNCLFSEVETDLALAKMLGFLKEYMPSDRIYLVHLDYEKTALGFKALVAGNESDRTDYTFPCPTDVFDDLITSAKDVVKIINRSDEDRLGSYWADLFRSSEWSGLFLMLQHAGLPMGMVAIIGHGRNRFSQGQARLLAALHGPFLQLLSGVLKRQAFHTSPQSPESTASENTFFREAASRICGEPDFERSLLRLLRFLGRFMPADALRVQLVEGGLGATRTISYVTNRGPEKQEDIVPFDITLRDHLRKHRLPDARIVNRPNEDPASEPFVKRYGQNWSSLSVFLTDGQRRIGLVDLSALGHDRYNETHLHLFTSLHDLLLQALINRMRDQEISRLRDMLTEEKQFIREKLHGVSPEDIIGADTGLKSVMEMIRQVAPLDSPVLLLGETGVGKDVVANAIHQLSSRRDGPLVRVNSGSIPETLIDSELFGYERGAFTGALTRKRGRFERAHQGTIFLDEIGELPLQAQVRMLRVLQSHVIERVGGYDTIPVDIRIIAATHRNLEEMVRSGRFREDLWFRLNVFPVMIPPLRARKADIPQLVSHFTRFKSQTLRLHPIPKPAPGAIDRLINYEWPGNVRELENVVERELILSKSGLLHFRDFTRSGLCKTPLVATPVQEEYTELDQVISKHINRILDLTKGQINGPGGAAELMKVHPNTLRNRMKRLGIKYGRARRNGA